MRWSKLFWCLSLSLGLAAAETAALILHFPTDNLTTTADYLHITGALTDGKAYLLNGAQYAAAPGSKFTRQVRLTVGLNALLLGTPAQPELYSLKILRLPAYTDLAALPESETITAVAALGYVAGDYPRLFNPRRAVARQELAAAVLKLTERPEPLLKGVLSAADLLVNQGLLHGYPDGLLHPEARLTKGQLAVVLARLLDLPLQAPAPYSIVQQEHWADPAIEALAATGLYAVTEFKPRGQAVTKAELAVLFSRLPQVKAQINALEDYSAAAAEPLAVKRADTAAGGAEDFLLFEEAAQTSRRR